AFDGRLIPATEVPDGPFNIVSDCDLVGEIWEDRPEIIPSEIYALDPKITGENTESKLSRLRQIMAEKGADYHIITALDEIAWLYNLRGNDVKHTPVFFAYALITSEVNRLYAMNQSAAQSALSASDEHMQSALVRPYEDFLKDIATLPAGKILLDEGAVNCATINAIPLDVEIISDENPIAFMKSIKNATEIKATKNAHLKDGAAMANFLCWLKTTMAETSGESDTKISGAHGNASCQAPITELSVAAKLHEFRAEQEGFMDLSFETISGYGSNGAIIHYAATEETNKTLKPEGLYLLDSGGQYNNGTTDITRTIALGALTDEMKTHYTAVLKGHIALATAKFQSGTVGADLDAIARKPLIDAGLNYNHGTGHGVGHLLGCHEGPQSISPRDKTHPILPGTINSNEPGVYIEGSHGIRLENEILCVENSPLFAFETITFCPFERDAILPELLTDEELAWLNNYHKQVYDNISPLVGKQTKEWLKQATREISK
ncbi:MAG: aminopeptidase P family protein, partial [Paludibacteraceae bacterium]|nr:aminopeptidase P family protein [Paludibacteraceae bacterium]